MYSPTDEEVLRAYRNLEAGIALALQEAGKIHQHSVAGLAMPDGDTLFLLVYPWSSAGSYIPIPPCPSQGPIARRGEA